MAARIIRRTISQPTDGTDFTVTLSPPEANDDYAVCVEVIGGGVVPAFYLPDVDPSDRTTTGFRVVTSGTLPDAAELEFIVVQVA